MEPNYYRVSFPQPESILDKLGRVLKLLFILSGFIMIVVFTITILLLFVHGCLLWYNEILLLI